MTEKQLIDIIKRRKISFELAIKSLAKHGYCPNLLNDDNGHWAVQFDGFQSLPSTDKPEDVETHFWIEESYWHDDMWDALIYALEN